MHAYQLYFLLENVSVKINALRFQFKKLERVQQVT